MARTDSQARLKSALRASSQVDAMTAVNKRLKLLTLGAPSTHQNDPPLIHSALNSSEVRERTFFASDASS
jgi:hypothetical protein